MSTGISTKKSIALRKCKECGEKGLNIYDNGTYHCGNCCAGGMICAHVTEFEQLDILSDKELMGQIKNPYIHGVIWTLEKLKIIK